MTQSPSDSSTRTIRGVEISFNIIDYLQQEGRAGITELASELDHSKSTIYSHLHTLEKRQFLVRENDKFRLSLRVLDMASHVKDEVGNYDVIREQVEQLANDTGEIIQFGIEEHGEVAYLHKATGNQAVETLSHVGGRQPMYSTALGKTILAYLPEDRTEEIVQSMEFEPFTPETISSAAELYDDLQNIRERGYGIDDEENIEGLRCVAAPVKKEDSVLGAVSITGPASRLTDDRIHNEFAEKVRRAANVIEINTKYSN